MTLITNQELVKPETQKIAYWPSNDWCYHGCEEIAMLNKGLSDDYTITDVPYAWTEDEIDEFVTLTNQGEG